MSKIIKVIGIVIAENSVSDSDKMLTILTSEYGKINAIAKRSRQIKSSLLSGTQFLCLSNFTLYKGSTTFRVNEAIPIEMFYNIYEDYDKLLLATNITKTIHCVALENYFEHNLLKLFLITLKFISKNSKSKSDIFIESVFKLRLLAQLGFTPELVDLPEISSTKNNKLIYELIFDFEDNRVIAVNENIKIRNSIRIQKETLLALKYIFSSNLDDIYDFTISDRILIELSKISDKYFDKCIY